jgi:hypothetical protein
LADLPGSPAVVGPGPEVPVDGPSGREGPVPARGFAAPWSHWIWRPVVIYLGSRVVTVATLVVVAAISHQSVASKIDRWDSRWFLRAAAQGWPTHVPPGQGPSVRSTIAFFPLFPLTIRWLSAATGLTLLTSGVIIASVTGLTATAAVWALVCQYADRPTADRATLLVAVFPGSFVLSLVYSEGLAITLLALGLLALMRGRWVVAGVLGLLATATAPIALAFELSCAWCAYRAIAGHRDWRVLAAPVLTPLGFIAYQLYLWRHTGDLNAWRLTERNGWTSYPSSVYPVHLVVSFVRDPVANTITTDLLVVGMAVAIFGAVVAIRTRLPMPLLLYGLGAALLGMVAAPVGLRPRFVFMAFPLIIAVGAWLHGRRYVALVSVSVVLLAGVTAYSVTSWSVFP